MIELGIAPIGWTNDDLPEIGGDITFEQCISEMALAGYKGCEVGTKFPNSSSFSHLILSKFSILVPVKIMLDSPFCFIQEPKTSNSTSYIISGGSAKPE